MGTGFELANGDIVTPVIEDDLNTDPDKSHLAIVKQSPSGISPVQHPVALTCTPEAVPLNDKETESTKHFQVIDEAALQVLGLLDARKTAYDILLDGNNEIISATSISLV